MSIGELTTRREQILGICAQYGARNVRIFGSVARGDARPDSDVDFLVDIDEGRSLFDLGALVEALHRVIGRDVDVVTERGLRPRIRDRVLTESVPL